MDYCKKSYLSGYILLFLMIFTGASSVSAQTYEVINYSKNDFPTHGVKIKTNLPFVNYAQMMTLRIEGYNYSSADPIGLNLVWYIYDNKFAQEGISSWGNYVPDVFLTNDNGFVSIYIDDKPYFQRFKITAFCHGLSEPASWFQGWTVVDEAISGTQVTKLSYKNSFKGNVVSYGGLYAMGNLGVGTVDTKGYKLAVAGNMIAESIKVQLAGNWPDYVFAKSYQLPTLNEEEKHIKEKGHLKGIPSAEEVKANGIDVGEMNAKLLQKIEELTLHLIDQNKINVENQNQLKNQQKELKEQQGQIKNLVEKLGRIETTKCSNKHEKK